MLRHYARGLGVGRFLPLERLIQASRIKGRRANHAFAGSESENLPASAKVTDLSDPSSATSESNLLKNRVGFGDRVCRASGTAPLWKTHDPSFTQSRRAGDLAHESGAVVFTPRIGAGILKALNCRHRLIIFCAIGTSLVLPQPLGAQDGELAVVGHAGLATGYVYHGVKRAATSWQVSLEGSRDQWRGNLWANLPVHQAEPEELQLTLGYDWPTVGPLAISVSGTHFWIINRADDGNSSHSVQPSISIIWNTQSAWRPGATFAYDLHTRTRTLEAYVGYDIPLKKLGAFLELRAFGGLVAARKGVPSASGSSIRDSYLYYGADFCLPYRIGAQWIIEAKGSIGNAINQDRAWSGANPGSGPHVILSVSLRLVK